MGWELREILRTQMLNSTSFYSGRGRPSVDSWVSSAVSSLTKIFNKYNLKGTSFAFTISILKADPDTLAECIGRLIKILKTNAVISFASIAPFDEDDDDVQSLEENKTI
ncbi:hypothetical protein L6164_019156 [Bauhinia variegata]|uniref:Uncharacterized protein n=1 Tax=Bauhinia variegata TaxID=167791 RepID=A0ACB9NDK1_BAUVA|nr:hypothetical protein L6164_019156 [Bauhinia variegata]